MSTLTVIKMTREKVSPVLCLFNYKGFLSPRCQQPDKIGLAGTARREGAQEGESWPGFGSGGRLGPGVVN